MNFVQISAFSYSVIRYNDTTNRRDPDVMQKNQWHWLTSKAMMKKLTNERGGDPQKWGGGEGHFMSLYSLTAVKSGCCYY